jgi:hypothetical protein
MFFAGHLEILCCFRFHRMLGEAQQIAESRVAGLGSGQAAPLGIAAGGKATGPSVLVSARRTLTKPNNA